MDYSGKITLQSIGEFIKSKLSGKSDKGHTHSKSDITDFPSALPANGGNADTVDGKVPYKIFYDNGLSADLNGATQSGCYATSPDTLNVPFSAWWLVDTTNYNNQFIVQKAHTIGNTAHTVSYIRNYANNAWSDWEQISTTPIKSTTFSGTTGNSGNMVIWATSERKIPLFAEIVDCYCFPFLSSSSAGCYMIHAFDSNGDKALTTVSGTVYYIEV